MEYTMPTSSNHKNTTSSYPCSRAFPRSNFLHFHAVLSKKICQIIGWCPLGLELSSGNPEPSPGLHLTVFYEVLGTLTMFYEVLGTLVVTLLAAHVEDGEPGFDEVPAVERQVGIASVTDVVRQLHRVVRLRDMSGTVTRKTRRS